MDEDFQFSDTELEELSKLFDNINRQDIGPIAYLTHVAVGNSLLNKPEKEKHTIFWEFAKKYAALSPKEKQQVILGYRQPQNLQIKSKIKKMLKEAEKTPGIMTIATKQLSKAQKDRFVKNLFFDEQEYNGTVRFFNMEDARYDSKNIYECLKDLKVWSEQNCLFIIKTNTEKPETIVAPAQPAQDEKKYANFQDIIVIGDFDCKGYIQQPKTDDDIKSTLKILPLAVYGKLICSNWNYDLFYEIEKFPYAKAIDCSYSISDLYDLYDVIQRLPTIDGKFFTSQIIIQPELMKVSYLKKVLKKETQEDEYVALNDIVKFLEEHPDIQIVAAGDRNLMASIDVAKQGIEKQDNPDPIHGQEIKPSLPESATQWAPSFISLDKVMSDLRDEQGDIDFSVLNDNDIQNAIRDGMNSKFVKTDDNGRIIKIRADGTGRFHTVVINAARNKINEHEQPGSGQISENTGNTVATNTQTPTPNKRTLWITQSVLDTLKEYNGQPFKDRIKWLQSLSNPIRKFKIQNVEGIKNGKAYELTPEKTFKGGMRLYVPSVEPEQMLAFCLGSKKTQNSTDIDNVKASASLFAAINDELKKIDGSVPQTVIHGETLYNFNAPETRKLLGIENQEDKSVPTDITRDDAKQAEQTGQQATPFQQAFSANKNDNAEKPKNRWQPVEELIQIYCEKHPDANKQEITEKVYAGCKELEDKEYLRKTDGGEYVVFDTDADGFIDLLLSGQTKKETPATDKVKPLSKRKKLDDEKLDNEEPEDEAKKLELSGHLVLYPETENYEECVFNLAKQGIHPENTKQIIRDCKELYDETRHDLPVEYKNEKTETKQNSRKVQDTNKNTDQTEQPHTEHKTIKSARFIVSQLREKYDCNIDQDLFMLLVNKYNTSFQKYLEHHDGDLYEIKRQIEELSGYIKNNIPHLIGKWKTSEQAAMLYYNDQYKIPRGVNVYDLAIVLSTTCRELGVNDETKNYFAESGDTYFWNITNLPTFIKTYLPNFVRIPKESTLDNTQATSETPQQTDETNWITIEELAARLQTTPDIIRQVNNQYKVSHNHPDWTSGRQKWRFNAAKIPDYEQEYGDIIREITQLKSANNSGIPQEPAPGEQPTPVDVAIAPGPKSESGTKFDGMLGVKALTTKLDAMMKLIDQKLKEKEDTEHEIQTLDQEISEINDQAIAKIQANDIDSATELLNQTKQKKRELEEAKERVKQLDQNIAELRAQSNEASEKLRRFQQAQEKRKAAEQAVQIANEEARKANEDLQQFLENGFNLD